MNGLLTFLSVAVVALPYLAAWREWTRSSAEYYEMLDRVYGTSFPIPINNLSPASVPAGEARGQER